MTRLAYSSEETFHLTATQDVTLFDIAHKMKESGLSVGFISSAIRTALHYEGVADLVFLWGEESDPSECDEIIADIQDLIDDCSRGSLEEYPMVKFSDLDAIRKDIRLFKDSLLRMVDEEGGISRLSKITGIPQPSLSRFFNSNAMPRRQTLLKISSALKLEGVKVNYAWVR